jgi:3-oxoacyl-[acyl-carrier-protein] synthase II
MSRRVVVTGIGAITPVGHGSNGLWCGLREHRCAIAPATRFDASLFRSHLTSEIRDFDPLDHMDARSARRMDRCAQFGVAAARQAVEDAGLDLCTQDPTRIGVSLGSALGGVALAEHQHTAFLNDGLRGIGATLAIAVYGGAAGSNVAMEFGARGPCLAQSNSCASGAMAIGEALRAIQRGDADVMLAGGTEAPLAPLTFGAFALIHAMSRRNDDPRGAVRPFDAGRDGFVMAEGAGVLFLEEFDHARRRGARIRAELVGYGQSNDAYHMTAPRPDGVDASRALNASLADANLEPETIGYVNAHATGTPLGDAAEACAIASVLGGRSERVAVSSTKGQYGHMLGASGAIEAAITCQAIERGFLPGTFNLVTYDGHAGIDVLPQEGRACRVDAAVSTSFGFGGANAALVFASARE